MVARLPKDSHSSYNVQIFTKENAIFEQLSKSQVDGLEHALLDYENYILMRKLQSETVYKLSTNIHKSPLVVTGIDSEFPAQDVLLKDL